MLKIKKFLILLSEIFVIFFALFFLSYIYIENNYSCIKIKKYSIGEIDKKFNLKKTEIIRIVEGVRKNLRR
jgi:hypothetical protein